MANYCTVGQEQKAAPLWPILASGIGMCVLALVVGYFLGARPAEPLTAAEAARILAERQGWAGFTETKDSGASASVNHAVFCPNCGVEVGAVMIDFHQQASPATGSRSAIWRGMAEASTPKVASLPN